MATLGYTKKRYYQKEDIVHKSPKIMTGPEQILNK
jgi:hypothetical protein